MMLFIKSGAAEKGCLSTAIGSVTKGFFAGASIICLFLNLTGCELPDRRRVENSLRSNTGQPTSAELESLAKLDVVGAKILLADQLRDTDPQRAESLYIEAAAEGEFKAESRLAKFFQSRAGKFNQNDAEKSYAHIRAALALGDDSVLSNFVELAFTFPALNLQQEVAQAIIKFKRKRSTAAQYSEILMWEYQGAVDQHAQAIESTCLDLGYYEVGCYQSLVNLYQLQNKPDKVAKVIARVAADFRNHKVAESDIVSFAKWATEPTRNPILLDESLKLLELVTPYSRTAEFQIARLLYENPQLQQSKRLLDILAREQAKGNWQASELEAEFYFYGKGGVRDPERATPLVLPLKDRSAAANYILGIIYRDGIGVRENLDLALRHLLFSARFGYAKADVALAQTYIEGRGVHPNYLFAYSFASLALANNMAKSQALLEQATANLSPAEIEQAKKIMQQEQSGRAKLKYDHVVCCTVTFTSAP